MGSSLNNMVSGMAEAIGLKAPKSDKGNEAVAIQKDLLDKLEKIDLPDYEKMRIALELPELVGEYRPELLGRSSIQDVQVDPSLRQAQMLALENMQEYGRAGLDEGDLAAMRQLSRDVGSQEQARQQSILASMAQRGTLDSGAQLAAQLSSSQGAANQQAARADQIAMQAAQAKKEALAQSSNMATGLRSQDLSEAMSKAQAEDAVKQFNVSLMNQTQAQNLAEKQRIEESKSALKNQQQMYNVGLEQQKFEDKLKKAGASSGSGNNLAQTITAIGQAEMQGQASKNQATAGILGAAISKWSDKNTKKNIKELPQEQFIKKLEDMLSELKAYKYNYKKEFAEPKEEHIGVMAQDLEKSELGSQFVFENEDGVKMVDYGKMLPTLLASQVELYERLKKLEEDEV
jgi:hypothetical protein